jgi:hypothetical protein
MFNPIASTILKGLKIKVKIFNLAPQWFGVGNQGSIL